MTEILKERASTGCKVLRTRNHGRQLFSRRTQKVIYQIRYRHKFSRLVHVTGQEAFEENSDVNEGGTALTRPSGQRPGGLFILIKCINSNQRNPNSCQHDTMSPRRIVSPKLGLHTTLCNFIENLRAMLYIHSAKVEEPKVSWFHKQQRTKPTGKKKPAI